MNNYFYSKIHAAYKKLSSLPISPFLSEICENLKSSESHFLILTAETGAGKSTAVPISLLEHFSGKILMLEPRRLAAHAISDRLSNLLNEKIGETIGYKIHLESKISEKTRLEVITEAILIRQLQNDPLLEDINVIVLDEFHERSIYSDLVLALLKETMQLRDDLFVVIMSATINYRSLINYLDDNSSTSKVMHIPGRTFPVEIEYKPDTTIANAIFEEIEKSASKNHSSNKKDSILTFLPGLYEIKNTKNELENLLSKVSYNVEILILHSSISLSEQKKILSPCDENFDCRVILSSSIAETSITVPDVTVVIDSGLSRVNKLNIRLGMNHLITEKESLFSAEQRTGRAGRTAAGRCIRLWNKNEIRNEQNEPEILRADLTQLVLECCNWGATKIDSLKWLTSPPVSAWNSACELLKMLHCIEEYDVSPTEKRIKITEKGKHVLTLGLNPRLACVALSCNPETILPFSEYANATKEKQSAFLNNLKKRLEKIESLNSYKNKNYLLNGFPDRLAKLSENNPQNIEKAEYQFPSGRKALLSKELLITKKIQNFPEWVIAPEVDAGEKTGKIYSFESISDNQIKDFLTSNTKTIIKREFLNSANKIENCIISKKEITSYGAIILKEKKLQASPEDFKQVLCDFITKNGLFSLPLDSQIENFLIRTEFYIKSNSENQSDLEEKFNSLNQTSEIWLQPFINSNKIQTQDIFNALYWHLNGSEVDKNIPIQITLSNGRKIKIKYEKKTNGVIQPISEIIIQQIFGCFENPKILKIPVLLKLLSPARRPLQITDDLEHFWNGAWLEICKEMKGRYPKHNWDYRIADSKEIF